VIFKTKPNPQKQIIITRQVADGIITFAKARHPNEMVLVLQGKSSSEKIIVEGLIIPPFASSGPFYSGFPIHDLPFDSSYVGSAHSHPGGSNKPSLEDLNRGFYSSVSIIISHPYEDETIAAYNRKGEKLELKIVDSI
jgi:proteasome lid subunit RPN8/RPN11